MDTCANWIAVSKNALMKNSDAVPRLSRLFAIFLFVAVCLLL